MEVLNLAESKPFLTIDQQVRLLESRGLQIGDAEKAKNTLSYLNYYRLSGYTLTLRKDDVFYDNISLDDVLQIYNFDAELRTALLHILEYIEVFFRTHVGYYHAKKYGPLGYLDKNSFKNADYYLEFIEDFNSQIKRNEQNEVFIKHHNENYDGKFPIWVAVEVLSFGRLSRIFKNLDIETKTEIANIYYNPIRYEYLENWLQGFAILRNICAHRGRLYNRYFTFTPKLSRVDNILFDSNGLNQNNMRKKVFTYIFITNKLIKDQLVWSNFINRLETIINKYPFVKLSNLGFPPNWRDLLLRNK